MAEPKPEFKAPNYKDGNDSDGADAAKLEKSGQDHDAFSKASDDEHNYTLMERQRNPYLGKSEQHCLNEMNALCDQYQIDDLREELLRGVRLAYSTDNFEKLDPTDDERHWIDCENSTYWKDKWRHTGMLYYVALLCGSAAIVQGMDQTAVNGAQLFYNEDFDIVNTWERGLVNGAPYLCCVVIGCWTSPFLNKWFGRRGTIFISCFLAIVAGIWQGVTFDKWQLFGSRFFMGLAIGAKSSTTPAYAAECAPPKIRGALGTQWQMWTAFGIMMGFLASVVFYGVRNDNLPGLNWRLMLASTSIPPIFVCAMTYFAVESPRWLMSKGRYRQAYDSLCKLRKTRLMAARDLYDIHIRLMLEKEVKPKTAWTRATKLFAVPRNRRAAQSAFFVMFMQQFCGVNVIAYYSSEIFRDGGFSPQQALLASLGTGIINWLFAIPGMITIDSKGRRWLLLTTFPYMSVMLFFTGFSFWIPSDQARLGCIATGIYLFMIGYSPGMGPVPFTYSAESFPLAVRDTGMSFATSVTWGWNFILALTWPSLVAAFEPQGAFSWYAAWNIFGFVFTWFCLPETKERPLEELDAVFNIRTRDHAMYYLKKTACLGGEKRAKGDLEETARVIERRPTVTSTTAVEV
ncbi:Sugar (and other) transporter-like protein 45 [Elsinoe fawcettii]|nr:Sugar (and other) transporter-like protein 45 [Elsinoe fawcettii]